MCVCDLVFHVKGRRDVGEETSRMKKQNADNMRVGRTA
jgi:hypothetical protein